MKIGITFNTIERSDRNSIEIGIEERWYDLAKVCGFDLEPLIYKTERNLNCTELSGVILSGGKLTLDVLDKKSSLYDAVCKRTAFEYHLITEALEKNIPILGVCRGFQVLNSYFDGNTVRIKGHSGIEHPLSVAAGSDFRIPNVVNSYHDNGITLDTLSPHFTCIAQATDRTVEAAHHKKEPILCVMWHPERSSIFDKSDIQNIQRLFNV